MSSLIEGHCSTWCCSTCERQRHSNKLAMMQACHFVWGEDDGDQDLGSSVLAAHFVYPNVWIYSWNQTVHCHFFESFSASTKELEQRLHIDSSGIQKAEISSDARKGHISSGSVPSSDGVTSEPDTARTPDTTCNAGSTRNHNLGSQPRDHASFQTTEQSEDHGMQVDAWELPASPEAGRMGWQRPNASKEDCSDYQAVQLDTHEGPGESCTHLSETRPFSKGATASQMAAPSEGVYASDVTQACEATSIFKARNAEALHEGGSAENLTAAGEDSISDCYRQLQLTSHIKNDVSRADHIPTASEPSSSELMRNGSTLPCCKLLHVYFATHRISSPYLSDTVIAHSHMQHYCTWLHWCVFFPAPIKPWNASYQMHSWEDCSCYILHWQYRMYFDICHIATIWSTDYITYLGVYAAAAGPKDSLGLVSLLLDPGDSARPEYRSLWKADASYSSLSAEHFDRHCMERGKTMSRWILGLN